jgi:ATP-grasp ribosomal peptide maturase
VTVLILAEDFDPTVDRVVEALAGRGVPVFRCDTAWFPAELTLDARLVGENWTGSLKTRHRAVDLERVRAVWYRRPTAFSVPSGLSAPDREHVLGEARFGLGGVLATLPAFWMNHPGREGDAAYKPRQLAVAARCGLAVPRTLITNDPRAVTAFADSLAGPLVVKMLGANVRIDEGAMQVAHTHLMTDTDLADLDGVRATAHMFQGWVDKAHEARVVVVGERQFAIGIHAGTDAARIDWRADYDALSYTVLSPPAAVADALRRFMDAFGLTYGAFDFVVTPQRRWVFLECNPGGQYGWLEGHTGLPITDTVADALATAGGR